MSQKRKTQRARRAAQEEKQARKVVNWIFGALVVLAVIFLAIYIIGMS